MRKPSKIKKEKVPRLTEEEYVRYVQSLKEEPLKATTGVMGSATGCVLRQELEKEEK